MKTLLNFGIVKKYKLLLNFKLNSNKSKLILNFFYPSLIINLFYDIIIHLITI
jgi:hypothetical protein